MMCPWCENEFVAEEIKNLVQGKDNRWYHVICLKQKNDLDAKENRDRMKERT